MDYSKYIAYIQHVLDDGVTQARQNTEGNVADYIPELNRVEPELIQSTVYLSDGALITHCDRADFKISLQSVSKLVLLIGLLEEFGSEKVFSWINAEPSGQPFASAGHLERYGTIPSNPLINAGALALTNYIPGDASTQDAWIKHWADKLFDSDLSFNEAVFQSEIQTADRNRSLAYLMKSTGVIKRQVSEVLPPYCRLCAYEATIEQIGFLPMLLANGGLKPDGARVISEKTCNEVVAIMATCGLYDESGMHLVRAGLPAKSAVSGLIVAVATGRGGIAVYSPRINSKATSVRGQIILNHLAAKLDWHFASPWGFARMDSQLHKVDDV